jgi:hypothetical protein
MKFLPQLISKSKKVIEPPMGWKVRAITWKVSVKKYK